MLQKHPYASGGVQPGDVSGLGPHTSSWRRWGLRRLIPPAGLVAWVVGNGRAATKHLLNIKVPYKH